MQVGRKHRLHDGRRGTAFEQALHRTHHGDGENITRQAQVVEARVEWSFTPEGDGTRVAWTYTFTATNGFAAMPLSAIAKIRAPSWRSPRAYAASLVDTSVLTSVMSLWTGHLPATCSNSSRCAALRSPPSESSALRR